MFFCLWVAQLSRVDKRSASTVPPLVDALRLSTLLLRCSAWQPI
ncbi:MAG: hypothetical protein PHF20_09245 [Halothiobacillaceae bacterium]|nr:hypothetical protein [Halothiobacillaceae bacterium]